MARRLLILTFVASLFPYVSVGVRFPAQVQPAAALLAAAALVALVVEARDFNAVRLSWADLVIIAASIWMAVYISSGTELALNEYLRKNAVFIVSVPIILAGRRIDLSQMPAVLLVASTLYAALAVVQYVSTSAYLAVATLFTETKNVVTGERGAASFAPEATDFGFTATYLLLLSAMCASACGLAGDSQGRRRAQWAVAASLACVLLSQSAAGIFATAGIGLAYSCSTRLATRRSLRLLSGIPVMWLLLIALPVRELRGFRLLFDTLADPASLFGTSAVHRIVHNWVGLAGLVDSKGVGFGGGSFTSRAPVLYDELDLERRISLSNWYRTAVPEVLADNALGVFPQLLLEYGLMSLLLILPTLYLAGRSSDSFRWPVLVLLFLTWLQSFPSAYPLFWLVVGLRGATALPVQVDLGTLRHHGSVKRQREVPAG